MNLLFWRRRPSEAAKAIASLMDSDREGWKLHPDPPASWVFEHPVTKIRVQLLRFLSPIEGPTDTIFIKAYGGCLQVNGDDFREVQPALQRLSIWMHEQEAERVRRAVVDHTAEAAPNAEAAQ